PHIVSTRPALFPYTTLFRSDAVHAGDVDQPAPAARVHVRQAAAHQQERGGDHHLLDEVEPVRRELGQRRDVLQPGVVDQDVDLGRQRVEGRRVGQVDDVRLPADVRGDRLGRVGVPVDHVHRGTRRGQRGGARPADAAAAPGDQGGPGRQIDTGTGRRRRGGRRGEFACHGRKQYGHLPPTPMYGTYTVVARSVGDRTRERANWQGCGPNGGRGEAAGPSNGPGGPAAESPAAHRRCRRPTPLPGGGTGGEIRCRLRWPGGLHGV